LEKSSSQTSGKSKNVLPVALSGMKEISCFGCGIAGHKKGDPICKAGKYDAHANAPQDYKDRMAKKRKAAKKTAKRKTTKKQMSSNKPTIPPQE
jgi:hypothetical protein